VVVIERHFQQQYFGYIVTVNLIGGANHLSAECRRQTLSHNVVSNAPRHERDSNSPF
jgi:hypothetical protein